MRSLIRRRKKMKAILEFNLPEDQADHKLAISAIQLSSILYAIDQQARNWLKYGGNPYKEPDEVLEWVRREIDEVRNIIEE